MLADCSFGVIPKPKRLALPPIYLAVASFLFRTLVDRQRVKGQLTDIDRAQRSLAESLDIRGLTVLD